MEIYGDKSILIGVCKVEFGDYKYAISEHMPSLQKTIQKVVDIAIDTSEKAIIKNIPTDVLKELHEKTKEELIKRGA